MTVLISQPPLISTLVAPSAYLGHGLNWEQGGDQLPFGRADCTDARWFVRVVLTTTDADVIQSVRVIVEDREARRILLHTVWTDATWQNLPLLAAHVGSSPLVKESLETIAWDLAAALLVSLQHDASKCLEALGAPIGSLLPALPGRQEREAMRNVRDAMIGWRPPTAGSRR